MDDDVLRRTPSVLTRSLEGEYVLYHPGTDEAMTLDPIASIVWDVLEREPTRGDVIAALAERFGEDPARIAEDIESLLGQLADAQLISVG